MSALLVTNSTYQAKEHSYQDQGMFYEIESYYRLPLPCNAALDEPESIIDLDDSTYLTNPMFQEVLTIFKRVEKAADIFENSIQVQEIGNDTRTRLMIKNIPVEYLESQLAEEVAEEGFQDKYTFIYMPIAKITSKRVKYAFINMKSLEYVKEFHRVFSNRKWKRARKAKNCILCYAKHI